MSELLAVIDPPDQWHVRRFDRLVDRVQEIDRPDLQPLSVFLGEGVVPRSTRDDNYNRLGADLSRYLVVKPGDIVFNKLRTWQGGLGVSEYEGIVSPAYYVCRPRQDVEPRFLHYLLRSATYLQELTRISKWMPPSQFDISWEDLRLLPTLLPSQGTQWAIADFLDVETARIDALIAKKRKIMDLLKARFQLEIDRTIEDLAAPEAALGRFVLDFSQGSSPQAAGRPAEGDEWGVLKLSAVKFGRYDPQENKALVGQPEDSPLVPRTGDLLVTRSNTPGYVGDVAAVTRTSPRRMLPDLIYRLRLDTSRISAEFAAYALLTSRSRHEISSLARGSSQ